MEHRAMDAARNTSAQSADSRPKHDNTVLVLQGGGALGAYQAGVYEGLVEADIVPTWIAGVSIGAINAALIAGNAPDQRLERLREFWDRVSSIAPVTPLALFSPFRPWFNSLSATAAMTFGVPSFYRPRLPPPFFAFDGSRDALSFYHTEPLKVTLEGLVDFDLINRRDVRLSLGAVNVKTGNSVYFDNQQDLIGPDHVRASGALPPGFPPIEIEGESYWDGGIVSNTPLWYVLDDSPKMDALIIQVDLFNAVGEIPLKLDHVLEREKDIQFSSKTRFNTKRVKELSDVRAALGRLLTKLPPALAEDSDVKMLSNACQVGKITVAHLINRRLSHSAQTKDYEFSRATVNELWAAGLDDVRRAVANPDWADPEELWEGMRVYDLTR
jgi:NTE family protein